MFLKKSLFLFCFFFLFFSESLFADFQEITGEGFGKTLAEAKNNAVSDLGLKIRVNVDTSIIIKKRKEDDFLVYKNVLQSIKTKSSLPLFGINFSKPVKKGKDFYINSFFTSKSKDIYKAKINETKVLIEDLKNKSGKLAGEKKAVFLEKVLFHIDEFTGLQAVCVWLGLNDVPVLPVSREDIITEISKIKKKADTLDFAVSSIAEQLNKNDILSKNRVYLYPVLMEGSQEITEFSKAFHIRLSSRLNLVSDPVYADIFITGNYNVSKAGIDLLFSGVKRSGKIIFSSFINILPKAYINYSPFPVTWEFTKDFHKNSIVSENLKIEIRTDKGDKSLLYKKGEEIELFVRMNKPGSFFILVHNFKVKNYTYLLDFYDGMGTEKFIFNMPPDKVNKWVSIGEFEIAKPFGVETLQVFCSTGDVSDIIPEFRFDFQTGLYRVSKNPVEAVFKTRGLIRKKKKKEKAEASITINSFPL